MLSWVVPFALLNSVTASLVNANESAGPALSSRGVLLGSVCQRPIKANSAGKAVHAAIEGFTQNAHWQDIVFSMRRLPLWNDEGVKGILVSVLEALYMRCSRATFWGQTSRRGEREKLLEKERPGGEEKGGIQVFVR